MQKVFDRDRATFILSAQDFGPSGADDCKVKGSTAISSRGHVDFGKIWNFRKLIKLMNSISIKKIKR